MQRFQLMLHVMACPHCREFDRQSDAIDQTLQKLYTPSDNHTNENLSEEEISKLQKSVNQKLT